MKKEEEALIILECGHQKIAWSGSLAAGSEGTIKCTVCNKLKRRARR